MLYYEIYKNRDEKQSTNTKEHERKRYFWLAAELNWVSVSRLWLHIRGPLTANLRERNRFAPGEFWRGSQTFFYTKPFAPARFAVPGVSSLTALSRHDSHNSLPSCLPFGGGLTHQHIAGEWICLFFDSGHFPNMVFTIFLFKCSGTRNLQESPGRSSLGIGLYHISYLCIKLVLLGFL